MKSISNISGGSQSGGHIIQNASGTDLTQRDTLQFDGYLKASDDLANSKTVVSDTTTISWDDWNELTDVEKAGTHWIITDVPEVGGEIHTDLMTKLWENPNSSVAFGAQTVNLSSSDYDFLLIECKLGVSAGHRVSYIIGKGRQGVLTLAYSTGSAALNLTRLITGSSDAALAFDNAYTVTSSSSTSDNTFIIPTAIYGFKKTITIDTSALIANVSTDASKCMIDEDTSIVDAINTPPIIFEDDSQTYTVPAISVTTKIEKTPTVPEGYTLSGVINCNTNFEPCIPMGYIANGKATIAVTNISNQSQVGQSKTCAWTNIYTKNYS